MTQSPQTVNTIYGWRVWTSDVTMGAFSAHWTIWKRADKWSANRLPSLFWVNLQNFSNSNTFSKLFTQIHLESLFSCCKNLSQCPTTRKTLEICCPFYLLELDAPQKWRMPFKKHLFLGNWWAKCAFKRRARSWNRNRPDCLCFWLFLLPLTWPTQN